MWGFPTLKEKPPISSFPSIFLIFIFKFLLSIFFIKGILFHLKLGEPIFKLIKLL